MPFSPPSPDTLIEDQPQASFQPPSPDSLILPRNALGENAEDLKTAMARVRRERFADDIGEKAIKGAEFLTQGVSKIFPTTALGEASEALGLKPIVPKEHVLQMLHASQNLLPRAETPATPVLGNLTPDEAKAVAQGAEESVAEQVSGMTRPENVALLAAGVKSPGPVARAFQISPFVSFPGAVQNVEQASTRGDVAGTAKAIGDLSAQVALPAIIEHGIPALKPDLTIPDFRGADLRTPEGATPSAISKVSEQPKNERIENALQRKTTEIVSPLRERPVESVQQVPAESPGTEAGSGGGAAEEKRQVVKPLKLGEVPTPHDLHGATLEEFMAYHDALKGPGTQRQAVNEFGKSLTEDGIKEADRLAQLSREQAGKLIKGEGDLDTKFRQSMEENQRTQFLDEGARTAKARKAVGEGMDAAEAIKKFGVPPSAVEDMAKVPEFAAAPKAPEVNFGIWPESEWTAASLAKQTPGERIGKAKFLGLRDKEGQLILGPKTLADAASKRIQEIKTASAKPKTAPAPAPEVAKVDMEVNPAEAKLPTAETKVPFGEAKAAEVATKPAIPETKAPISETTPATKAAEPATKAAELPSSGNQPTPGVIANPTKESNHIVVAENGTLKLQKKALNGEAVDIGQIPVDKFGKNATAQNKAIRQLLGEGKHSSAIVSDIRVAANEALKESADVAKSVENQREAEIKANALRLHIIPPVPDWLANIAKSAGRALYRARKAFPTIADSRQARHWMDQSRDAADNLADIAAQQMGKRIKTGHTDIEDRAASAMIAGKFDPAEFPGLIAKAIRGGNLEARQALEYALGHWTEVEPMARAGERIFENQLADENAAGINTEYHEGYLPGVYDEDLWMGAGRPFVIGGRSSGGVSTGFKKGKTYATPYDAISDGYVPKTLKLSDLVENRVKRGQRLINRKAWANALRSIVDPTDHKPIVEDLQYVSRGTGLPGFEKAPIGYVAREIIPGTRIAVRENYAKLFDALTGRSVIAEFEPGGIPVGTMALEGAGGIKHGLLVFDSFHASRILQKELFLTGKVGYRKGQSLLEYADADLAAAVRAGDIKPEWAAWARANRPTANLLIKAGLNVGRIQEGMYNSLVRDVPVIGSFNKWVFEKMTRGAMLQSGLLEFERVRNANPGWSDEQVAAKVARDLNKYFGNLGRQGVFKSPSFQDAARLVALAPNWVESMARSELGGVKQLTYDPIMNRSLHIGSLGRGLAQGLAAYFVGTQLLNLATRGHLTWQNPEEGHKWDAWVPDIAGRSGGYFLSPMGVVAELTHDMIKYSKTEPNVLAAAWRIIRNRSSPFFRAGRILLGGRDWDDSKINDAWDRVKKAAVAVLPTPIPLQTVGKTVKPGQVQRQIVSSLGFKLDTAETPRLQIMNQGRAWALNNADPKIKAAAEREQTGDRSDSVYKPLRLALSKNDRQGIIDEVRSIVQLEPKERQAERLKEVLKNVDPFSSNGIKPFATPIHSKAAEVAFVKSLDANGKAAYKKAVKEAVMDFRRVTEAIYGRPRNPEVPPGYESFLK